MTYTNTPETLLYGIGQGGRASSTAWLIISIMLIDLMKDKTDGITYSSPDNTTTVTRTVDAFVDDCTEFVNDIANKLQGK